MCLSWGLSAPHMDHRKIADVRHWSMGTCRADKPLKKVDDTPLSPPHFPDFIPMMRSWGAESSMIIASDGPGRNQAKARSASGSPFITFSSTPLDTPA